MSLSLPSQVQEERRQSSQSQTPEVGPDHITGLPDPLRRHIISLLPITFAVRTGALSTEWKDFWKTCYPKHTFHTIRVSIPDEICCIEQLQNLNQRLKKLRTLFLSLHLSFHFHRQHVPYLNRVLRRAAAKGAVDLSLDLRNTKRDFWSCYARLEFPADFSSLVRLSLSGLRPISPPSYYKTLTKLEYLCFDGVNVPNTAFRRIFANCRQLRSLDVRRCPDLTKLIVSGSKIENVTVVECRNVSEVLVRSRILKKFHSMGKFADRYKFRGADHLEDVYMHCVGAENGSPVTNWVKAMGDLRNATVLTLCGLSVQNMVAPCANGESRTFQNLEEFQLLLTSATEENFASIYKFFRLIHCQSLARLFIQLPNNLQDVPNLLEEITDEPSAIVFDNLKTIKITGFKGHQYEMSLVRFLLSKSTNLESIIIVISQEDDGELRMVMSEVTPWLSTNAKLILDGNDDYGVLPAHKAYR